MMDLELDFIRVSLTLTAFALSVAYVITRLRRTASGDGSCSGLPASRRRSSFRKREKIIFYGRKLIRKVSETQKLRLASDIARQLRKLQRKRVAPPRIREPSQSFLEVDLPGLGTAAEQTLPAEIMYMLRNVRVLGHFEEPIFLEICRFIETRSIPANAFLFRIGDYDDSIYVVQSGRVQLYIRDPDGSESCVKEVHQGESIHSLLSILDVITGSEARYRTVFAIASENSMVLRLPMKTLSIVLDRYPESLIRVVQIIAVRLQRVTVMALHNYLGLCQELFSQSNSSSSPRKWRNSCDDSDVTITSKNPNLPSEAGESPGVREGSRPIVENNPEGDPPMNSTSPKSKECKSESVETDISDSEEVFTSGIMSISNAEKISRRKTGAGIIRRLAELLGIEDEVISGAVHDVRVCPVGEVLLREGEQEDCLYFVISGCLIAKQRLLGNTSEQRVLYEIGPGELVGSLAILTGEPSLVTVETEADASLAVVDKKEFYAILKQRPQIVLNIGRMVLRQMSPFVRQIDFALDWVFIEAGRALYRQKDPSDSIYIVLNGRLRSIYQLPSGKKELAGEHGRGELVGLVEVLTQTDRSVTMMAVRDTELAYIPDGLLHLIKRRHPQIVTRLIHLLGQRILGHLTRQPNLFTMISKNPHPEPRPLVAKFSTVAVLPVCPGVPLTNFTRELRRALDSIGPTLCLSHETMITRLGSSVFDGVNSYRLSSWLSQQEDTHRLVLYQCDFSLTSWTHRCIRQADCILVVAVADQGPAVRELERQVEKLSSRAQKELVLLHREHGSESGPRDTVEWLGQRNWITAHYHIRCSREVFASKTTKKSRPEFISRTSDFSRLARILTGTAVGVVFGGGAARGCAHVGILKAMVECDLPIDMIGGTSIGAFMGALWAQEINFASFRRKAKEWSTSVQSIWSLLMDLTCPVTSLLSGSQFNRKIESALRDCNIEDLWLPYFCVTTDITSSKMRVHTDGCLWRYVRSSMSIAGYFPPLCDPVDGHLLLDGAYVNNLPADVMKNMGANTILAVDVSSESDTRFTNYGDELSGWWLLWRRWWPWSKVVRVPNMAEVQTRLAYVSCERLLESIKSSEFCDYLRPPISKYQSLQFAKFDEISEVGYRFARALFADWHRTGRVRRLFVDSPPTEETPSSAGGGEQLRVPVSSYTNLADLLTSSDFGCHCALSPNDNASFSDRGEADDRSDRISVVSEPIISPRFADSAERNKAGSEGASMTSILESRDMEEDFS